MPEPVSLIATDLDGTLLNSRKEVPSGFEDLVIRHDGISFVIASGRQYYNIFDLFPKCNDRLFFIAENGALVIRGGEVIHKDAMRKEDVLQCIRTFSDPSVCALILCGVKSAYMLKSSSRECFENSYKYYKRLDLVSSLENIDDDILKIVVFVEGYRADEYYREISPVNDRLDHLLSGDCWIDIANKTVSKGKALRIIREVTGATYEGSVAFGDYLNDASLLENAGQSYAMTNAHPGLKKAARYEAAASNDENGVMETLKILGIC